MDIGVITPPDEVKPYNQFWLDSNGVAYRVSDHLQAAQRIKAESDDWERSAPWGYQEMFDRGWLRIHTEKGSALWVDGVKQSIRQKAWIHDAKVYLGKRLGVEVKVVSGLTKDSPAAIDAFHTRFGKTMDQKAMPASYKGKLGDSVVIPMNKVDSLISRLLAEDVPMQGADHGDPAEAFQEELRDVLSEHFQIQTFAENGVMTRNKGLIVTHPTLGKFQLTIVSS